MQNIFAILLLGPFALHWYFGCSDKSLKLGENDIRVMMSNFHLKFWEPVSGDPVVATLQTLQSKWAPEITQN